jgi:sulfur carrier protein
MNIIINEKPYRIKDGATISDALKEARIDNRFGIAVAVNNVVIPKTIWENTTLNSNDQVTIINAIFGG